MNKKRNERELPGNTNAKQNGETVAEQEKAKNLTEQSAAETGLNNSDGVKTLAIMHSPYYNLNKLKNSLGRGAIPHR